MPTYEYLCKECGHGFETVQSIMAPALKDCEECRTEGVLKRVLHAVSVFAKGEARTIGQVAARNTAAMGHYEYEDRCREKQEAAELGRQQAGRRPKAEKPWWRDSEKPNLELAKLAPNVTIENGKITKSEPLSEKAQDYIMTGKK